MNQSQKEIRSNTLFTSNWLHSSVVGVSYRRACRFGGEALEEQAKPQGIAVQYKDLQGYPVATLDAPAVIDLKNSCTEIIGKVKKPLHSQHPCL